MKAGWITKTFDEVADSNCSLSYGIVQPGEEVPNGLPVVRPTDLTSKVIKLAGLKRIDPRLAASYQRTTLHGGEMLLCVRGSTGTVSITSAELKGANVTRGIVPVRFDTSLLNPAFGYYVMTSDQVQDQIREKTYGTALMQINIRDLRNVQLSFPPLAEQQRIVGILDEAFEGIATAKANAEKNLQNARALFESHLHIAHADKALLGDLVCIKTGKLDANAAVEGGEFPFFTCSRDVFSIDTYAFDCEAILLAGNNAVGDFNVKHYNGKFNAYQRTYVITVNEKNRVLHRFLYFQMLKSLKKFKAQSVGAGTKFLKLGMIKDLEIELPSLDEQQRIVSTMDAVREETDSLATIYERKLAALDDLKKSLLHQAFTGEL